jgi:hypothetical protein
VLDKLLMGGVVGVAVRAKRADKKSILQGAQLYLMARGF